MLDEVDSSAAPRMRRGVTICTAVHENANSDAADGVHHEFTRFDSAFLSTAHTSHSISWHTPRGWRAERRRASATWQAHSKWLAVLA